MRVNELRLSIHAISDPRKISEIEEELDAFIIKNSRNPFMLSVFIKERMESTLLKGSIPIVLVLMTDGKIIGVAPLLLRKKFGIQSAKLLFDFWFSPDFTFDTEYSEVCMQNSLTFIFDHLECRFAKFDLPAESPNFQALEQQCKVYGIDFRAKNHSRHRILPVDCTWKRFQELKGSRWRNDLERTERKLDQIGSWRIMSIENVSNRPDVLERILDVERMSWKEPWRSKMHMTIDEDLFMIWEGSQRAARIESDFKCSVWFLEVNNETAAYAVAIKYKGTAFLAKTSFDNRYRKFYIGKLLTTMLIRDLFNGGQIKTIDFMTDLPFMNAWTFSSLNRATVLMWKGEIPTLAERVISNACVSRVLRGILDPLSKRLPFLSNIHLY